MANWRVSLMGGFFELRALVKLSADSGGEWSVTEENGAFVLRSRRFEGLDDASQVLSAARALAERLNGIARLVLDDFDPVQAGSITMAVQGGPISVFVWDTVTVRARVETQVVDAKSGKSVSTPPLRNLDRWVALGDSDPKVQEALRLIVGQQSWDDLYRAFEVVEGDVGGRMIQEGWTTQSQLDRFTWTANCERHARDRVAPPKNPMSLPEAQQFVKALLRSWLDWKSGQDP